MGKRVRYGTAIFLALFIGAAIAAELYIRSLGPRARQRVVEALQDRFDADVDLQSLSLSIFPLPSVTGEGLRIKHKGWNDAHPLIFIGKFSARTNFLTLIAAQNHVSFLRLEGLQIHVARGAGGTGIASSQPGQDKTRLKFLIQEIVADGTLLEIEPKVEGKLPLRFDIAKLTLHSVGPGQPMKFVTTLTNAKPPGLIDSTGSFGPWQKDDPRSTAVSGDYTFQNADLGVFKGIAGILASKGSYHGILQHIEVDGVTDTPKFAIKSGRETVDLKTKFHAIVNGSDGDTILDPVDAKFLNSEFICKGGIVHQSGHGKTVSLDAITKNARIEDILRLVVGGEPIMKGDVDFKSKIVIPPGKQQVLDKLDLDGKFMVSSVHFTKSKIQERLNTLSARAQGIAKNEEPAVLETAASNFKGNFILDNGLATFSALSFDVPGAQVTLAGTYNLISEKIDMGGEFRMQATLSDTQSGIKHWLLKPIDPIFKKDGAGFQVPLSLGGTKDHPVVGVEIFHRDHIVK